MVPRPLLLGVLLLATVVCDEDTVPSGDAGPLDHRVAGVTMRDSTYVRCDSGECSRAMQIDMWGPSQPLAVTDSGLYADAGYVVPDSVGLVIRESIYHWGSVSGGGNGTYLASLPYKAYRFHQVFVRLSADTMAVDTVAGADSLLVWYDGTVRVLGIGDSCTVADSARYFEPSLDGTDTVRWETYLSYRTVVLRDLRLASEIPRLP
jgi:hypothetical protein